MKELHWGPSSKVQSSQHDRYYAFAFSTRKNSWTHKPISHDYFPYRLQSHEAGVTVNGNPEFSRRGDERPMQFLICFDAEKETIRKTPPREEQFFERDEVSLRAAVMNAQLCVMVSYRDPPDHTLTAELWKMEKHEVPGSSWSRMPYKVALLKDNDPNQSHVRTVNPSSVYLIEDGNIVQNGLQNMVKVSLPDENDLQNVVPLPGWSCNTYVQSLLSPWQNH
ncbi:hypothetical protein CDL15_Pgr013108 [Punica granatum]|uniref:F-box associated beta-propeller type 1 domain-containing protein n=1 Tax=Punica granatum TaxID=22663 RepID=A0A218WJV0_PUNGR|nr:hypothetical protein CDL15_Pgr013108 [Punica granatum]PKI60146.1 hypothetical protein CRG98_019490 [Punica granatum]